MRDDELRGLLATIHARYHYDFRGYAQASLRRRLTAAAARFGCDSLGALADHVAADPAAFTTLLDFLTIQVSELYRDPHYFRAIRTQVVPYLSTYAALKVWVAGCANGEEAYSLAIVLAEEGLLDRAMIYATDINPRALRIAESGVYELDRIARFSAAYTAAGGTGSLSDYYTATGDGARFDRRLRQAIVFSDHSLATDSVFAECQLVSCRNVLIYFERELQERALDVLTDALGHRGFLGLGSKETLRFSRHADRYAELDGAARIYQKR